MKKIFLLISILFLLQGVYAIEEITPDIEETPRFSFETLVESPYLLGNFKGYREKLENHGINIQSSYMINSFFMKNREKRSSKGTYQGLYNLSGEFDFEKMNLYKGGKVFILYQAANKGTNSMNFLNSFSDINSYDPMQSINQISELYYEQSIKDDLLNIKIGKQDANMDFQALNTGFEFLNLSFSFIPNTPMPLFPSQQMGVRARLKLKDGLYLQNGFYDGNLEAGSNPKSFFTGKNNYFNITEIYKNTNIKGKEGKILSGGWIKTRKYSNFYNTNEKRNNYGFYAGFEQKILDWFEDKSGGINVFAQFGYARKDINEVPYYGGIGAVLKGITKKRKEDEIGIGFNWHHFDRELKSLEGRTSEKVIEIFYKIKLTNSIHLQPDVQYIIKPSGTEKNAFAFGIRSVIIF